MNLRPEQLAAHLARGGLRTLYTVHGDEPLLVQEAADAVRAAARSAGYTERKVFTVAGAYFDWSQAMLQIAVVLASVHLIIGNFFLLGLSGGLGALGVLLMLNGFTLLVPLPFLG